MKNRPPKYVWLIKDGKFKTAMRYRSKEHDYYRDAGAWSIKFTQNVTTASMVHGQGGVCKARATYPEVEHLDGADLFECTKAEWERDNEGYV